MNYFYLFEGHSSICIGIGVKKGQGLEVGHELGGS